MVWGRNVPDSSDQNLSQKKEIKGHTFQLLLVAGISEHGVRLNSDQCLQVYLTNDNSDLEEDEDISNFL